MRKKREQSVPSQISRGLMSSREEKDDGRHEFIHRKAVAVFPCADQGTEQIIAGRLPTLSDENSHVVHELARRSLSGL